MFCQGGAAEALRSDRNARTLYTFSPAVSVGGVCAVVTAAIFKMTNTTSLLLQGDQTPVLTCS